MPSAAYAEYRGRLEAYVDRTAHDAWAQLTSDAPVSKVRAKVRAGRDAMRATLLGWLPEDLSGRRVLDAGCGTGALAVEAARRGAQVTAVDVSPRLVAQAQERAPRDLGRGAIRFVSGDMLDPSLGRFDHVVAMDSLIHYPADDISGALAALAGRTDRSLLFTVTPRTAPLVLMLAMGRMFPRADRSPAVAPADISALKRRLSEASGRVVGREQRVTGGFYTSHAVELVRR